MMNDDECESQHYSKLGVPVDPRIPKSFKQAIQILAWKIAIDKECEKFAKNDCFIVVPFNGMTRTPVRAVRVQAYVRIGSRTIRSTRFIAMIPACVYL